MSFQRLLALDGPASWSRSYIVGDMVGYARPLLWLILSLTIIHPVWMVTGWPRAILTGLLYLQQQAVFLGHELSPFEPKASPLQHEVLDLEQKVVLTKTVMMHQWAQHISGDNFYAQRERYRITVDGEKVPILEPLPTRPCEILGGEDYIVITSPTPDVAVQTVVEPTMTDDWTDRYLELIHRVFQVDWEEVLVDEKRPMIPRHPQNDVGTETDEWIGKYLELVHRVFKIGGEELSVNDISLVLPGTEEGRPMEEEHVRGSLAELKRLVCEEAASRLQGPNGLAQLCSH
ncbi:hypothetical protein PFICI_04527 [Pestalotiopsis fici W106-1]|uniref:Uncharacterized protein n=1 Tax=Pestalotiopsis fici (strain W106-1 / CGMCC3.15140) TaxID=1229662 RepID=W3XBV0_PESFW|nr:uncharacterized protein PFICI_04527 [Pestalotiopsis fici W106-1]ETS82651.1 hypothetical protein PFICI_04527 [Pestalotiopsis fici W106-1]